MFLGQLRGLLCPTHSLQGTLLSSKMGNVSGPYHGLPDEACFCLGLATVFLMVTRPSPSRMLEAAGESFTACPAREGDARDMVEVAIVLSNVGAGDKMRF
ncbi:hypothetical protein ACOSQ3_000302 [Xanthoceras sorbifolium]